MNSRIFLLGFVAILAIQVVSGVVVYSYFDTWPDRGTFGDMFGVVNALFSGLAFAGVIYAIILQKEELGLQREELKLTREELSKSAIAQAAAERTLRKQAEITKSEIEMQVLSALVANIENEMSQPKGALTAGSEKKDRYIELKEKRGRLLTQLDKVYANILDGCEKEI